MAQSDYDTNDLELLTKLVERADKRVEAQLTTAIAADQRAMTFAGFLAAAAALFGGAASSVFANKSAGDHLGNVALWAALTTLVGMALCVAAARPRTFYSPGSVPQNWAASIRAGDSERERLPSLLDDYDHRIVENERLMAGNGRLVTFAAIFVIVGYVACGIAAVIR